MEEKLIRLLEYYLSLHEADQVFNMLFDNNVSFEEIESKLKDFHCQH